MSKLSDAQVGTLGHMAADEGRLERTKGGFWVTPHTLPGKHGFTYEWWANTLTVRALEARGLVERTHEDAEEWRDARRITDAGLAAVAAIVEESPVYARLAAGEVAAGAAVEVRHRRFLAAQLSGKHVKVEGVLTALGIDDYYECAACRTAWPCDVAKLLAILP